MTYKSLPLTSLVVNPDNDRHGELENETAAISRLFAMREVHMKALAKDLVDKGEVLEPPLVYPDGNMFIVADGNRRTTCLKLLANPRRAPTTELQDFFRKLRKEWRGKFPDKILCRVENDRERVDAILHRRHTGSQGGIGQSPWDDRMKDNFVLRTGQGAKVNVADEIEKRLMASNMLPKDRQIPRSNMNRLLSAEALRNRLGISIKKNKFEFIRSEDVSLRALARVASDLTSRKITLDDIWNTEKKIAYIDELEGEGLLPTASDKPAPEQKATGVKPAVRPSPAPKPAKQTTLIPQIEYGVVWTGHLQRHREIWHELQFNLVFDDHPNAISVLFRVLFELSIDNYIAKTSLPTVHANDKLALRAQKVAEHLHSSKKIDQKYLGIIKKTQQGESLVSMDTLNRYVHSPNFAPSPDHLKVLWNALSPLVILCLNV
jgi:hypothetical protein